jgi:hypothetical protein
MAKQWLTERDVRQIAQDFSPKKTPHSVKGITVTSRRLIRAESGKFVEAPSPEDKKKDG